MVDQIHQAYAQMQPGDKMVMQLHKSQTPPTQKYQNPDNPPGMGVAPAQAPTSAAPLDQPPGVMADPFAHRQALIAALSHMTGRA